MTRSEELIWAAVFAAHYGKRNQAFGAGQASWDLTRAAQHAAHEATEAVDAVRRAQKHMEGGAEKQTKTYEDLCWMTAGEDT